MYSFFLYKEEEEEEKTDTIMKQKRKIKPCKRIDGEVKWNEMKWNETEQNQKREEMKWKKNTNAMWCNGKEKENDRGNFNFVFCIYSHVLYATVCMVWRKAHNVSGHDDDDVGEWRKWQRRQQRWRRRLRRISQYIMILLLLVLFIFEEKDKL